MNPPHLLGGTIELVTTHYDGHCSYFCHACGHRWSVYERVEFIEGVRNVMVEVDKRGCPECKMREAIIERVSHAMIHGSEK